MLVGSNQLLRQGLTLAVALSKEGWVAVGLVCVVVVVVFVTLNIVGAVVMVDRKGSLDSICLDDRNHHVRWLLRLV